MPQGADSRNPPREAARPRTATIDNRRAAS